MRSADLEGSEQDIERAIVAIQERFTYNSGQQQSQGYENRSRERTSYGQQSSSSYQPQQRNDSRERFDRNGSYGGSRSNFRGQSRGRGSFNSSGNNNNNYYAPQKRSIDHDEEGWDRDSNAMSFSNRNREPRYQPTPIKDVDEWSMAEMKSNFEPSVNTYYSSKTGHDLGNEKKDNYGNEPRANYSNNRERGGQGQQNDRFSRPRENNYGGDRSNFQSNNNDRYNSMQAPTPEPASYQTPSYQPTAIDWDKANAECEAARKERWAKCPLLIKNFYKEEHPETSKMTQEEIELFRQENNSISVSRVFDETADPNTMPKPITRFEYAFQDYPDLMGEIKKAGFDKPSPIQSQMWPILLRGEDCIGIAQVRNLIQFILIECN